MQILLTTRREEAERRNPIALLDLAAYLRSIGHAVDCYYLDQLRDHPARRKPYELIGLSVLQVLKENAPLRDALFLKKKFQTKVVVGGKWTQTLSREQAESLLHQGIQVCIGPGEKYFTNREIDFPAYPSWDRVDFETLGDVRADIMSTRGCPYHCHFCHNTEGKLSFFSAERTADNIELLFLLGLKQIFFCDDIFTLRPAHMEGLYAELKKRGVSIEHRNEFFTHIHHINPEILRWIKAYKPFRVNVGVESGDDRMLRLMGKGFDSETAFRKIKMLSEETRMDIGALFIIGFPGENEESLQNTLRFIKRIRPMASNWVSYYQPVRGTKGFEMALGRNPGMKAGRRNMSIPYVDPNLSKKMLFKYNYQMMDYAQKHNLRSRWINALIEFLPYRLLARLRLSRQKKRLRDMMDAYGRTG